jgi:hypothetical protein
MSGATHEAAVFRTRDEGIAWLRARLARSAERTAAAD